MVRMAAMGASAINALSVLLYLLVALACLLPLERVGIYSRPNSPVEPFGMNGFRRFHANDSLVGKAIPCTHDEKICLTHNLMFDPKTDKCKPLGENTHDCAMRASRGAFKNGTGHIIGVCQKYDDPCWYTGYRMAFDGRCYSRSVVADTLCGCDVAPSLHPLGGVECRCSPAAPANVSQPDADGRCRVPDFRNPRPSNEDYPDHPLRTHGRIGLVFRNCSAEQRRCFGKGKVWVAGARGCHALLKRGPCGEDFVVVLDGRAVAEDRLEAACAHRRGGCPRGRKRMGFDGRCHADREMALLAPGAVLLNVYGVHEVLDYAESVDYRPNIDQYDDTCAVNFGHFWPLLGDGERPESPPCSGDGSPCPLYDIVTTPPFPEFD